MAYPKTISVSEGEAWAHTPPSPTPPSSSGDSLYSRNENDGWTTWNSTATYCNNLKEPVDGHSHIKESVQASRVSIL